MSAEQFSNPDLEALNALMAEQTSMTPEDQAYIEELKAELEPEAAVAQLSVAEVADRNAEAARREKDALAIGKFVTVNGKQVLAADNWNYGGVSAADPKRTY